MIKENLFSVEQKIQAACKRAGRKREEVTLIAVSKTKPVSMIQEVLEEGILDFGENKVQELTSKFDVLPNNLRWHLIGHLQTNKVKYVVDKAAFIHSVDSYKLAEQINKEAAKKGIISNILIEVNIAREETKYGVFAEETYPVIKEIAKLKNICVRGLMTIAPFVDNSEKNREHFRNLRQLMIDIKMKNIDNVNIDVLSMGMTGDYEVAIEEGATMIRVGTGIFGERDYSI
ncbi:YggS family pyridoxal phosphate-dependent enzyme [Anaerocolumna sp. MB42-C2]|uniref:YggS family pyridoxal phosphate-dependent enzyme n=1 Tax=Anaerocolumna sp. MB42-C2 TaxID=3070997 RepID=UPI0027E1B318|nr:YggS family pyridoxal phosphate-dependent enzyme [Anaerocolumna sp. MB42-C2]WMJ88247.1 YggS family pyridoxal phosphate-dependent enzyme [Anaerocolumna sp. MB42-C2]